MNANPQPFIRSARWLGLAGLLPFILLASVAWLAPEYRVAVHMPLVAYGAVILAFVGALHWGIAMMLAAASERQRIALLVWSAVPAILAWIAVLMPVGIDLALLVAAFWIHFAFDYQLSTRQPLPAWYLPLRTALTAGASMSLLAALAVGTGHQLAPSHPFLTGSEVQSCPAMGDRKPGIAI